MQKLNKLNLKNRVIISVDPELCEPWHYANRQENDYGDINELIKSIKNHSQLQPGLLRKISKSKGKIKYEVIFGCRRLLACKRLKLLFRAYLCEENNDEMAVKYQYEENKNRKDTSSYSDAMVYKKMLDGGLFNSAAELATCIKMPFSSLNDILSFTRIPNEILKRIPDIHKVSKNLAVKIYRIVSSNPKNYDAMLAIAPKIGKEITSAQKLEHYFSDQKSSYASRELIKKTCFNQYGEPLFTVNCDYNGVPTVKLARNIVNDFDLEDYCQHIKSYFSK